MKNAEIIAHKLTSRQLTLATAESCTGGLIAKTLTDRTGSSAFFLAGFVTYANAAKTKFLRVPASLIEKHGAVSSEVVRAMAVGARSVTGADLSVAVTGIAGPTGGTTNKPVGLVFLAAASADKTITKRVIFPGTRKQVREQACQAALEILLKLIK